MFLCLANCSYRQVTSEFSSRSRPASQLALRPADHARVRLLRIPWHLVQLVEAWYRLQVPHHPHPHVVIRQGPAHRGMFSNRCSGFVVAGIAQVTAGCEITHLRKNCAQVSIPNSLAKSGSGRPATILCSRAFSSGMLTRTAVPPSAAARRGLQARHPATSYTLSGWHAPKISAAEHHAAGERFRYLPS
jgi:hypothetical protein